MSFHVYVHPNPGQPIPKWWAYRSQNGTARVCWGKLGQMSGKADHSGSGPAKRFEKESEGYQYLGEFHLTDNMLREAMTKIKQIWLRQSVQSFSPEERKLLDSFCREMGRSISLIQGSSTAVQPPDPAPTAKPKKSRSVKKATISDLSGSWF